MGLYSYLSEPGFAGLVDFQDYESEVSECFDKVIPILNENMTLFRRSG